MLLECYHKFRNQEESDIIVVNVIALYFPIFNLSIKTSPDINSRKIILQIRRIALIVDNRIDLQIFDVESSM